MSGPVYRFLSQADLVLNSLADASMAELLERLTATS